VDQTGGRRNEPEVGRGMFGTGTKSGRRTSFRTGRNIEGEKIWDGELVFLVIIVKTEIRNGKS
jgi:hypothetical protein